MKAALITEEQIKSLYEYLLNQPINAKNVELCKLLMSLKLQEPVAYIAMIHEDHFNDVCSKSNGNSSTLLYAGDKP